MSVGLIAARRPSYFFCMPKRSNQEKGSLRQRALYPSSHKRRPLLRRQGPRFLYNSLSITQNLNKQTLRYLEMSALGSSDSTVKTLAEPFIELDAAAGFFAYFFCSIGVPLGPAEKKYVPAAQAADFHKPQM